MTKKYVILGVMTVLCLVLDQISKFAAAPLKGMPAVIVVPNFFDFAYAENRGAAFSLLADLSPSVRTPFFLVIGVVAIIAIGMICRKLADNQIFLHVVFGMLLGGALGNFIDRVAFGYVVDFIRWHYYEYAWPTFNIADVWITVGMILLGYEMLFGKSDFNVMRGEVQAEKKDEAR